MSLSLPFVKRAVRFQEGFLLSEPVLVRIVRLEVYLDFSLVHRAGADNSITDMDCCGGYLSHPDFKKWETAPYHPVQGFCDQTDNDYCFRSGSSIGLLTDIKQSVLVILPWCFVKLESDLVLRNNPFDGDNEYSIDEDDHLSLVVFIEELPSWKQRGVLTRYIRYLFGENCEARSLSRKK